MIDVDHVAPLSNMLLTGGVGLAELTPQLVPEAHICPVMRRSIPHGKRRLRQNKTPHVAYAACGAGQLNYIFLSKLAHDIILLDVKAYS